MGNMIPETLERKVVAGDLANNHAVLQAEAQKMVEKETNK